MNWLLKSVLRILFCVAIAIELIGCCCINSLMFHPVRHYDARHPGYVSIGKDGEKVAAIVGGQQKGRKALLYCHGNAEDATGPMEYLEMAVGDVFTIAAVDYPGYGLSEGSPDEKGCYRNVHRLYDWLIDERGFKPEDIIVFGFSIGTGPATELAATKPVGGLVLQAPYLSAPRIVTKVRLLPIDPFPNLKRIGDIKCPLVVIHGTDDSIIPFAHGKELFELAPEPKRFVAVEGADHNDLIGVLGLDEYSKLLKGFLNESCTAGGK